jgi:hypothetical protein
LRGISVISLHFPFRLAWAGPDCAYLSIHRQAERGDWATGEVARSEGRTEMGEGPSLRRAIALAVLVASSTASPGFAKHRGPVVESSDPCAAPKAYVVDHIARIKALRASTPNTQSSLFDIFTGAKDFDTKRAAEISELRYEADGVNALLQAGGCQSFDLDRELSQSPR